MDIIESKIDTNSVDYKKKYEAMESLVADLKNELKKAREERPQKNVDRLAAQGKMPVRKSSRCRIGCRYRYHRGSRGISCCQ